MVTTKIWLYIKEHMDAAGLTDELLAAKLGTDRTTVWRWHNKQTRLNPGKIAQIAGAIGVEPEELWNPPRPKDLPSLDALVKDAPEPVKKRAVRVVRELLRE